MSRERRDQQMIFHFFSFFNLEIEKMAASKKKGPFALIFCRRYHDSKSELVH
jgi:hypothetical protein